MSNKAVTLNQIDSLVSSFSDKISTITGGSSGAVVYYSDATTTQAGLMSAQDKIKLDSMNDSLAAKVDTVSGKQLSTNDFTNAYKSQLDSLNSALSGKVDTVSGKQLSTNDYTTAEKNKLGGIAANAQVNVIESVKVNGTALTPDANKAVNIDISGKVDKVTGKQLSTNDYTTAEKNKLASLASITAAGSNITIIGGTISAGNSGGNYSNATSVQSGLMSAEDKQHLDTTYQSYSSLAATVIDGLSDKFFPSGASVNDIVDFNENFDYLNSKYVQMLEGSAWLVNTSSALPKITVGGTEYSMYMLNDNVTNCFGTSDHDTAYRVTVNTDTSTFHHYNYLTKLTDRGAVIITAKDSVNSSGIVSKHASLMAYSVLMPATKGKPSIGSATSILSTAAYADSNYSTGQYGIYGTRSIYDPSHVMLGIIRPSSSTSSVIGYASFYHKDTTTLGVSQSYVTLGTQYDDSKGKTDTQCDMYFVSAKVSSITRDTNGFREYRLNVSGGAMRRLPFFFCQTNTWSSSDVLTKYTDKYLVHGGVQRATPTHIIQSSLASASATEVVVNPRFHTENGNYIAGCFLTKDRTTAYVVCLSNKNAQFRPADTPNLVQKLFDDIATIYYFDLKTPAVIRTDLKLSDIIDDLIF